MGLFFADYQFRFTVVSKHMSKTYKAVIGKRMMVASLLGRGFDADRWHVFETLPFGTCSVDPKEYKRNIGCEKQNLKKQTS